MAIEIDGDGRTKLHNVAREHPQDQHIAIATHLIGKGADPSRADRAGWTPLHFAAHEQSTSLVRYLLSLDLEVDPRDEDGNTPLFHAVKTFRGDPSVIHLLQGAGADPLAHNHHGQSPLALARVIANFPVAELFEGPRRGAKKVSESKPPGQTPDGG